MSSNRMESLILIAAPVVVSLYYMRGSPPKKGMTYEEIIKATEEKGQHVAADMAKLKRLMAAYVCMEDEVADELVIEMNYWKLQPGFLKMRILFFVAAVALDRARRGRNVWANMRKGKKAIRQFRRITEKAPHNTLFMLFLLEAELASALGQNDKAFMMFLAARATAKDAQVWGIVAVANERTARHFLHVRKVEEAKPYFEEAYYYFEQWGALIKVKMIKEEMAKLYPPNRLQQK